MNKHLKNINVQMYIKPKLRTVGSSIIHVPVLLVQSNIDEKLPILHGTKRPTRIVNANRNCRLAFRFYVYLYIYIL